MPTIKVQHNGTLTKEDAQTALIRLAQELNGSFRITAEAGLWLGSGKDPQWTVFRLLKITDNREGLYGFDICLKRKDVVPPALETWSDEGAAQLQGTVAIDCRYGRRYFKQSGRHTPEDGLISTAAAVCNLSDAPETSLRTIVDGIRPKISFDEFLKKLDPEQIILQEHSICGEIKVSGGSGLLIRPSPDFKNPIRAMSGGGSWLAEPQYRLEKGETSDCKIYYVYLSRFYEPDNEGAVGVVRYLTNNLEELGIPPLEAIAATYMVAQKFIEIEKGKASEASPTPSAGAVPASSASTMPLTD